MLRAALALLEDLGVLPAIRVKRLDQVALGQLYGRDQGARSASHEAYLPARV